MLSQGSGPLLKRSKLERPKSVHTAVFMPFSTTQGVCKAGTVANKVTALLHISTVSGFKLDRPNHSYCGESGPEAALKHLPEWF